MTISLYNLPGVEHTYGSLTANCDCAINKAARKYKRWTTVVMFLHILPSTCPRRHTGHCESGRDTLVTASMGATHRSLRVWARHTGHCEFGRDTPVTASLGATHWSLRVWTRHTGHCESGRDTLVNASLREIRSTIVSRLPRNQEDVVRKCYDIHSWLTRIVSIH